MKSIQSMVGVLDLLTDTAVFHTPGHTLSFLQIGEGIRLSNPKLLEGHGSVLDFLIDALVVEHRGLFQKTHLGVLRSLLLKCHSNGILRRYFRSSLRRSRSLWFRSSSHNGRGRCRCRNGSRRYFLCHGCGSRLCSRYRGRHRKGICLICCTVARAKDGVNVKSFVSANLGKRPRTVVGFTHIILLLSILRQKKTATAPMSNYGFVLCPIFHSSSF